MDDMFNKENCCKFKKNTQKNPLNEKELNDNDKKAWTKGCLDYMEKSPRNKEYENSDVLISNYSPVYEYSRDLDKSSEYKIPTTSRFQPTMSSTTYSSTSVPESSTARKKSPTFSPILPTLDKKLTPEYSQRIEKLADTTREISELREKLKTSSEIIIKASDTSTITNRKSPVKLAEKVELVKNISSNDQYYISINSDCILKLNIDGLTNPDSKANDLLKNKLDQKIVMNFAKSIGSNDNTYTAVTKRKVGLIKQYIKFNIINHPENIKNNLNSTNICKSITSSSVASSSVASSSVASSSIASNQSYPILESSTYTLKTQQSIPSTSTSSISSSSLNININCEDISLNNISIELNRIYVDKNSDCILKGHFLTETISMLKVLIRSILNTNNDSDIVRNFNLSTKSDPGRTYTIIANKGDTLKCYIIYNILYYPNNIKNDLNNSIITSICGDKAAMSIQRTVSPSLKQTSSQTSTVSEVTKISPSNIATTSSQRPVSPSLRQTSPSLRQTSPSLRQTSPSLRQTSPYKTSTTSTVADLIQTSPKQKPSSRKLDLTGTKDDIINRYNLKDWAKIPKNKILIEEFARKEGIDKYIYRFQISKLREFLEKYYS